MLIQHKDASSLMERFQGQLPVVTTQLLSLRLSKREAIRARVVRYRMLRGALSAV